MDTLSQEMNCGIANQAPLLMYVLLHKTLLWGASVYIIVFMLLFHNLPLFHFMLHKA